MCRLSKLVWRAFSVDRDSNFQALFSLSNPIRYQILATYHGLVFQCLFRHSDDVVASRTVVSITDPSPRSRYAPAMVGCRTSRSGEVVPSPGIPPC